LPKAARWLAATSRLCWRQPERRSSWPIRIRRCRIRLLGPSGGDITGYGFVLAGGFLVS
jgi:hypothetical protein